MACGTVLREPPPHQRQATNHTGTPGQRLSSMALLPSRGRQPAGLALIVTTQYRHCQGASRQCFSRPPSDSTRKTRLGLGDSSQQRDPCHSSSSLHEGPMALQLPSTVCCCLRATAHLAACKVAGPCPARATPSGSPHPPYLAAHQGFIVFPFDFPVSTSHRVS